MTQYNLFIVFSAYLGLLGIAYGQPTLFPTDLPSDQWVQFEAAGFSEPACGVIYRGLKDDSDGMPLGGIDTGCIDLEMNGMWGLCTIFNSHVPRRGPLNTPFLGMSVAGQTWVLCKPDKLKKYEKFPHTKFEPVEPIPTQLHLYRDNLKTAGEIHYWGHYPIADLEYETDAPISVGMRAWAPFIPGDLEKSIIPAIVFEVHLRNTSSEEQKGTLAFSFPGPSYAEADSTRFQRTQVHENFSGVFIAASKAGYALGAIGTGSVRVGGELDADSSAWSKIAQGLPPIYENQPGSSVAVDFECAPNQQKIVRFILTWCSPQFKSGGHPASFYGNTFMHRYFQIYPDPLGVAQMLANEHESLLSRILAWQAVIFSEKSLPVWLRESLVNNLHLITECGLWAAKKPPIPDWVKPEDGLFGMNESPRDCPQIECIPCSFYGNQPLVYFFPQLALSSLRGYKGYQRADGCAVWFWGGGTEDNVPNEFCKPSYEYQDATNGISLASMVDRYRLCWGDDNFLKEFYPIVKQNAIYTINLRPEYEIGDRVISMPTGNRGKEWFEAPEPGWSGMVTHVGGLHLAQLQIAKKMAQLAGDKENAALFDEWITAGSKSLEEKLWNQSYYLNFWEPETGKRSDLVFGYQLDGQWVSRFHGFDGVFQTDRIPIVLDTIRKTNVAVSATGAANYANPDGTPADVGGYGPYNYFPAEALMLAMTYMYEGQRDFGLELAHRTWENLVCKWAYTWNMPNAFEGGNNSGKRSFGRDYYQSCMLWSLPAAIDGQDFGGPVKAGGLVDRILNVK